MWYDWCCCNKTTSKKSATNEQNKETNTSVSIEIVFHSMSPSSNNDKIRVTGKSNMLLPKHSGSRCQSIKRSIVESKSKSHSPNNKKYTQLIG